MPMIVYHGRSYYTLRPCVLRPVAHLPVRMGADDLASDRVLRGEPCP